MNVAAPLAAPLVAWDHAALMRERGDGFAARLGTVAVVESARGPRRPRPRRGAVLIGGAVAVAAWVLMRFRRRS